MRYISIFLLIVLIGCNNERNTLLINYVNPFIGRIKKVILVLVNKWDLINKETGSIKEFEEQIKKQISPFTDVPILFVSVKDKQRLLKGLEMAIKIHENRSQKISTSKLNNDILPFIKKYPPPATKGKYIRIKYCTMLPTQTPTFAFFANLPQYIKEPYKRYLENKIRETYNFSGIPIQIYFRKK